MESFKGDDEGFVIMLEDEIDSLQAAELMLLETLESLDSTLSYVNDRIKRLEEQIHQTDFEKKQPLQFRGLQSVEAAKITLKTFFDMVLDLNFYQRDLEETISELTENISKLESENEVLQMRIEGLVLDKGVSKEDSEQSFKSQKQGKEF